MRHLRILSIALLLLVARGYSQQAPCPVPQSPRNVNTYKDRGVEYNFVSTNPLVTEPVAADTIKFRGQTLYRCDQHYHVPVENPQGIPQEQTGVPQQVGQPPHTGQWVEVHTVYAAGRSSEPSCRGFLDHDLSCCTQAPFVVRGYSAKVAAGPSTPWNCHRYPRVPIIPPSGTLSAEWDGSNTGPDKPEEHGCKPTPAYWSFVMGEFAIPKRQFEIFCKAHGARPVQTGNRVSQDLTLVGPDAAELDRKTCRWVDAGQIIRDEAEAQRTCPAKCSASAPLTRWNGRWQTTQPNGPSQCSCCPALRP